MPTIISTYLLTLELIAQAPFYSADRQTDRQTRLNALPHAGGYTASVGNYWPI